LAIIDTGSGDDEDGDDGGGEPAGVGAFARGNSPHGRSTPTPDLTADAGRHLSSRAVCSRGRWRNGTSKNTFFSDARERNRAPDADASPMYASSWLAKPIAPAAGTEPH
jgi:hypothetical protein